MKTSFWCLLVVMIVMQPVLADTKSEKMRLRLEELFVWKVSDTLELKPAAEAKFKDYIRTTSEKRRLLQDKLEDLVNQMDKIENKDKVANLLKEYKKIQKQLSDTQDSEIDDLEKIFGSKSLAQYLRIKRDFTNRLKDLAVNANPESKGISAEPRILEESENK